jgi:hypothetical protein
MLFPDMKRMSYIGLGIPNHKKPRGRTRKPLVQPLTKKELAALEELKRNSKFSSLADAAEAGPPRVM